MKITGIIVEYNPLHNGHIYHINETRRRSQCDFLIAVMSGNFVMRGEPAILNKQIRTELALLSGVDLVVELPYQFAVQSADTFAVGAIKILNSLQVNEIYFGSESDNLENLTQIAKNLDDEHFNLKVKDYLNQGLSYPKAWEMVLNNNFNANDILGIQYIRSILNINPKINYYTIKRIHNNYHDLYFSHDKLASATSIRHAVFNHQSINNYVPNYTLESLNKHKLVSWNDFFPYLKYQIIVNQNNLHLIQDVNEGIENRIINNINKYADFDQFVESLVSKRYTKSKIKRILTHILNNVTKSEIDLDLKAIRILGINKNKSAQIKMINSEIPLITNIDKNNYHFIKLDERVSKTYHLIDDKQPRKIPIFYS